MVDMTSSIADESVSIEKLSIKEEEARIFPVKTSTYQIRGVRDGEQNLTVDLVVSKFSNLTQITLTSVGKPGKKSLHLICGVLEKRERERENDETHNN